LQSRSHPLVVLWDQVVFNAPVIRHYGSLLLEIELKKTAEVVEAVVTLSMLFLPWYHCQAWVISWMKIHLSSLDVWVVPLRQRQPGSARPQFRRASVKSPAKGIQAECPRDVMMAGGTVRETQRHQRTATQGISSSGRDMRTVLQP
jgi:hypothetical protein